jgi:hypothetical protein
MRERVDLILVSLVVATYTAAWILGWWRWQFSKTGLDGLYSTSDEIVPGHRLNVWFNVLVLIGLVAQSAFLIVTTQMDLAKSLFPSGWFVWGNLAAWLLVAGLVLQLNHRRMHVFGLFVLPVALAFLGLAYFAHRPAPDELGAAPVIWRWLHAGSLVVGSLATVVAFSSGVLYMMQSNRLKQKRPSLGSAIPSLEKLQLLGERGLLFATLAVGLGWISGVLMNLMAQAGQPIVVWSHPVVWTASLLFGWLLAATAFGLLYEPARYGRKVAYLTIATGLFLAVELFIVWWTGHGAGGRVG